MFCFIWILYNTYFPSQPLLKIEMKNEFRKQYKNDNKLVNNNQIMDQKRELLCWRNRNQSQMQNSEITELKGSIKELIEMIKAVYEFEDA